MGPSPSPAWIPFPTAVYRAAAPRHSRPPPIRAVPGALPPSLRPYLGLVGVELERTPHAKVLRALERRLGLHRAASGLPCAAPSAPLWRQLDPAAGCSLCAGPPLTTPRRPYPAPSGAG